MFIYLSSRIETHVYSEKYAPLSKLLIYKKGEGGGIPFEDERKKLKERDRYVQLW